MNKSEFIAELNERLIVLKEEERRDILDEYEQHIDMKVPTGMTEEEVIADFGNVADLAADILEAYHVRADFAGEQSGGSGAKGRFFRRRTAQKRTKEERTALSGREEGAEETSALDRFEAACMGVLAHLGNGCKSCWNFMKRMACAAGRGILGAGAGLERAAGKLCGFCRGLFCGGESEDAEPASYTVGMEAERRMFAAAEGAEEIRMLHDAEEGSGMFQTAEERAKGSRTFQAAEEGAERSGMLQAAEIGAEGRGTPHAAAEESEGIRMLGAAKGEKRLAKNAAAAGKTGPKQRRKFAPMRAVKSACRSLWECCLWCLRWIWNLCWIGTGVLLGAGSCIVLFALGTLAVLTVLGYPLVGVTIGWIGLTLCMISATVFCFTLTRLKREKREE